MNDADRNTLAALRDLSNHAYCLGAARAEERCNKAVALIESQAAEIERLKHQWQSKVQDIQSAANDNAAKVYKKVEAIQDAELTWLHSWQERALPWLPKCGTACQCQGESDCELRLLRREAVKEQRDGSI